MSNRKELEAVKLHGQNQEFIAYIVHLGYGEYVVDGVETWGPKHVVVQSAEEVQAVHRVPARVKTYKNIGTGETVWALDHDRRIENLREQHGEKDDAGLIAFKDIEKRIEYIRLTEEWRPDEYTEPKIDLQPVSLKVTEVRTDSGDPDITSLWNSPAVTSSNRALYELNRDVVMLREAVSLCQKHGFNFQNDATRTYLEFAKLDGEYAFHGGFKESRPFVGTLDECKAEKTRSLERVRSVIRIHLAKKKSLQLTPASAAKALALAESVRNGIMGIDSKVSTAAMKRGTLKTVNELIAGLQQVINDNCEL